MTRPALHVVPETGEVTECPNCAELEAAVAGHKRTEDWQAKQIGRLERDLKRYAEAEEHHPRIKEIDAIVDRWRKATDHPKAKISKDRRDIVKARLKDEYTFEHLELAVDGIGAFRYVVNGERRRTGKPSQRHDSLSIALKGGENVERFAVLGHEARKRGWVTWDE